MPTSSLFAVFVLLGALVHPLAAKICGDADLAEFLAGDCPGIQAAIGELDFDTCNACSKFIYGVAGSKANCTISGTPAAAFFEGQAATCTEIFDKECTDDVLAQFLPDGCTDITKVLEKSEFDYKFCKTCGKTYTSMLNGGLTCTSAGKDAVKALFIQDKADSCKRIFNQECKVKDYDEFLGKECSSESDLLGKITKDLCTKCGDVFYQLEVSALDCVIKGEPATDIFLDKSTECVKLTGVDHSENEELQVECTDKHFGKFLTAECSSLDLTEDPSSNFCSKCGSVISEIRSKKLKCQVKNAKAHEVAQVLDAQCRKITSHASKDTPRQVLYLLMMMATLGIYVS